MLLIRAWLVFVSAFFSFGCFRLLPQSSLSVAPNTLQITMAASGPLAYPQSFTIGAGTSGVAWKANVSEDSPWIRLSAASGVTPAKVMVSLVDWRMGSVPPGMHKGKISVTAAGMTPATIPVTLTIVPKPPGPKFTYLHGPNGCTQPDGYQDAATCIVPDEKPAGNFGPPAPGGSYVDPNFGATVRVISPPGYLHVYSTPSAISAGNKYVLSVNQMGAFQLISPITGKVIRPLPGLPNQAAFWDAYDSEVFYYPNGGTLMKWDLRKGKPTPLIDFGRDGHGFTNIRTGGTGDTSKDNWVAIWDAGGKAEVCAVELTNAKSFCASYASIPGRSLVSNAFVDFANIAKGVDRVSGKRYVLLMADPSMAVFSVNLATGKLDFEYRGPESPEGNGNHDGICDPGENCLGAPHSDLFEDSNGIQYLVATSDTQFPGERALATYELNKGIRLREPVELGGGKKTIMTVFQNGANWTGEHIGCAKQAPYCVLSTEAPNGLRSPDDPSPIVRAPHITEIMVMRENGLEVRRLMQTRTAFFNNEDAKAYWSSPRACLSNDGTFVVADSNFSTPNAHRILRIETGFP
jgi:hypothetical protein